MRIWKPAKAWAAALAIVVAAGAASAQTYPTRPIQLVVAFAPGGAGDIAARLVARKMGERLGQQVLVENRPIPVAAVSTVANAKADGHTLLMAGSGTAVTTALFNKLPYDLMRDFVHISTLSNFDVVVVTDKGSPLQSLAEVLAHAKARKGQLSIGTTRVGSTQHLATEMIKAAAGIDAVIVPFKTTGEIVNALRSKDVHIAVESVPALLGQIRGGSLRTLAIASTQRSGVLPDVPTLAESGLPGVEASSWNGISVPAGTPPAVVERISREIRAAVEAPEVQKELQGLGFSGRSSTPEQMAQRLQADIAKWRGVIDRAGIARQ